MHYLHSVSNSEFSCGGWRLEKSLRAIPLGRKGVNSKTLARLMGCESSR